MFHAVLLSRARLIYEWILKRNPFPGPLPQAGEGGYEWFPLRQQTLADQFQCSRRTIGRCLAELKAARLLTDTGKRENLVKVYAIDKEKSPPFSKGTASAEALCEGMRLRGILPETDRSSGIKILPDPPFSKGQESKFLTIRYITLEPFVSHKPCPPIRLLPSESLNPKAAEQWRCYYEIIYWNLLCYDGKNGRPKLEDIYASVTENLTGKDDMEVYSNVFKLLRETPYYEACLESHERDRLSERAKMASGYH